jgi:hypothetical protein
MPNQLLQKLRALFGLPPITDEPEPSPLANYKWTEDPTYTEPDTNNPDPKGDALAGAVFKGRPSNPLSDDW